MTRSTGPHGVRLFSGLVLFFVITIQVAAAEKAGQQSDLILSIIWRAKENTVMIEGPSLLFQGIESVWLDASITVIIIFVFVLGIRS